MFVRMQSLSAGPEGVLEAGGVYDVDADFGRDLLAGGYATVEPDPGSDILDVLRDRFESAKGEVEEEDASRAAATEPIDPLALTGADDDAETFDETSEGSADYEEPGSPSDPSGDDEVTDPPAEDEVNEDGVAGTGDDGDPPDGRTGKRRGGKGSNSGRPRRRKRAA